MIPIWYPKPSSCAMLPLCHLQLRPLISERSRLKHWAQFSTFENHCWIQYTYHAFWQPVSKGPTPLYYYYHKSTINSSQVIPSKEVPNRACTCQIGHVACLLAFLNPSPLTHIPPLGKAVSPRSASYCISASHCPDQNPDPSPASPMASASLP